MSTTITSINGVDTVVHTVVPYIIGTTKPLDGQRLDVVFWKTPKATAEVPNPVKRDSVCVSVPRIDSAVVAANAEALLPHIVSMLQDVQHSIIKERVDAPSNAKHITDDEISVASCIAWLEASVTGEDGATARLTKESVGVWYDRNIADMLMLALAEKLGVGDDVSDEDTRKLEVATKMYRDKVVAMAGGATKYGAPLARSLRNALAFAPEGDVIASRFTKRLDTMIAADTDLFLAL